jgi:hypothetical protein
MFSKLNIITSVSFLAKNQVEADFSFLLNEKFHHAYKKREITKIRI